MASEEVSTFMYVIVGVLLAFGINQGMAFALGTSMPVVAVESNSMVPVFARGDMLILQGVPQESLAVDDVIVFIPGDRNVPIVHRIIEVNQDGTFQTKGDANPKQLPFEKRIEYTQIMGKQILIIPVLGWVKITVTDILLPNLLWVIVGGIIVYSAFFGFKKQ
jgi:signal peptidase